MACKSSILCAGDRGDGLRRLDSTVERSCLGDTIVDFENLAERRKKSKAYKREKLSEKEGNERKFGRPEKKPNYLK